MIIFAWQFSFSLKKLLQSWCDICWGLYQTNVFLHLKKKNVGQGISAAQQYLIYNDVINLDLHILPLSKYCYKLFWWIVQPYLDL